MVKDIIWLEYTAPAWEIWRYSVGRKDAGSCKGEHVGRLFVLGNGRLTYTEGVESKDGICEARSDLHVPACLTNEMLWKSGSDQLPVFSEMTPTWIGTNHYVRPKTATAVDLTRTIEAAIAATRP